AFHLAGRTTRSALALLKTTLHPAVPGTTRSVTATALSRAPRTGDQLVHQLGHRRHAEARGDHHHRAEASRAVQPDALADEALGLAHRAVRLGIAQLFGGEHAGHAV